VRIRFGLRPRIAATVAVAVLGSTVVVTFAAYELERSGTESRFVAAARTGANADLQQAANAVRRQPGTPAVNAVAEFVGQRGGILWTAYRIDNPGVSAGTGVDPSLVPEEVRNGLGGGLPQGWTDVAGTRMLALGDLVADTPVALVEFYDFGPVDRQLARLRSDLIRLDLVGLAVALVLGAIVATRISRPVRTTAAAARRLGNGALDTRVPVHGRDELGELAVSFNEMADRLSSALRALHAAQAQQRRFVSDVSHELRTPLAAMLAATEGLDAGAPRDRERAAELLGEQTRRMNALVEDLLEISRFDAGQARLDLEPVELAALVADAVRTVAPDHDVRLQVLGDPRLDGDARRLHTIVRNLVGNAVQHGAPPVRITVDGRQPHWVQVVVTDDGPGIDPAVLPTIFDRFVRADSARTGGAGSTGLGLAIALENAQLHRGTLRPVADGSATFVLTLPRTADGNRPGPAEAGPGR
jgi:two-component system sensor histidine kinase MtrB